ncbi:DUF2487 family protein [Virgibacillus dokdonensis]|uniref:DUF2487 family protein n=1 Tax=Virgibacillus dokdonensis TaxID=302167 RepID=A0A2K9J390_9BACI|nr:DUF2487 family protein [Virgibacillus dokdonensis]AUJ26417.1 hypothetical protein A21D_03383 [Virgibacillus dokdonensis]
MKWKKTDITQYTEAKEYIDTVLIPLMPFEMESDTHLDVNAFQYEWTMLLVNELEKELTGRMMLLPPYVYRKPIIQEQELTRIDSWAKEIKKQPFNHVFFLTLDGGWKKHEEALPGTLLWLPGMKSGDLHSADMYRFIRDQVEQMSELIQSYW